jgi:hypothetical protein
MQVNEQGCASICSIPCSIQCPRQDSNLRSRLRRGLLCSPLTSGNEFPHTMIGGVSGAAYRTWLAGTPSTGSGRRPGSDGRPGSTPAARALPGGLAQAGVGMFVSGQIAAGRHPREDRDRGGTVSAAQIGRVAQRVHAAQ